VNVDELAEEMTSAQLTEWIAYDRLEPLGGDRLDATAALIAWTIHSTAGGKGKIDDFRLRYGRTAAVRDSRRRSRPT
jgi:hypothetical protein